MAKVRHGGERRKKENKFVSSFPEHPKYGDLLHVLPLSCLRSDPVSQVSRMSASATTTRDLLMFRVLSNLHLELSKLPEQCALRYLS